MKSRSTDYKATSQTTILPRRTSNVTLHSCILRRETTVVKSLKMLDVVEKAISTENGTQAKKHSFCSYLSKFWQISILTMETCLYLLLIKGIKPRHNSQKIKFKELFWEIKAFIEEMKFIFQLNHKEGVSNLAFMADYHHKPFVHKSPL